MDRDQLSAFDQIVRDGSFSRAAQSLGLSQAAVSGRMQALEAELGAALFVRGARGVTLTGAGEAFLSYARRALAVLAEGAEVVRQTAGGQVGRVVVGAIDSVSDALLVPVVVRLRRETPDVVLSVRTGHTPQIVQELLDGIVQIGFVTSAYMYTYQQQPMALDVVLRLRDPLLAVVAPGHPLAALDSMLDVATFIARAAPFHETAWGTPEDARIAGIAQQRFSDHELPHGLMRQLILRGHGGGFLPASLVADDLADRHLVAVSLSDGQGLVRDIALVRRADGADGAAGTRPPLPVLDAFIALVRDEAVRLGFC